MSESNYILVGDARQRLRDLSEASVDTIVTSPPYFRLRDYGVSGQLGEEASVGAWVDGLVSVADELARVLSPTGTLWLNLGDSYSTHETQGAPRKSLLLGPERLAERLVERGWALRNKIVWEKSNARPSPVTDRLSTRHEFIYVFARSPRYYFDLDAIRRPHRSTAKGSERSGYIPLPGSEGDQERVPRSRPAGSPGETWLGSNAVGSNGFSKLRAEGRVGHALGKNPGDVWEMPSSNRHGAHHAVFPVQLALRAILAACPEKVCLSCGIPWRRKRIQAVGAAALGNGNPRGILTSGCDCADTETRPGLVLDPFMGSGSTAIAAEELGRAWLGIELNADYAKAAYSRIDGARRLRSGTKSMGRAA